MPEPVAPIAALAAKVRADIAEGHKLADQHGVELGPHDEIRHEHVLAVLAVLDAFAELPKLAAELEADAASKDPASTDALRLNMRARGLRDAAHHVSQSLAAAGGGRGA
jgi:hypothetical protein